MRISIRDWSVAKYWLYQCAPEICEQAARLERLRSVRIHSQMKRRRRSRSFTTIIKAGEYDAGFPQHEALRYTEGSIRYGYRESEEDAGYSSSRIVYKLLISKEERPRLYLFLYAIDRERFMHLLDFSFPKTEEEEAL